MEREYRCQTGSVRRRPAAARLEPGLVSLLGIRACSRYAQPTTPEMRTTP